MELQARNWTIAHVFDMVFDMFLTLFFCHAAMHNQFLPLDDWMILVQRSLRSLGFSGQCDLRQRRRLSVPSLRAKAAETWLGHDGHGSRLRGARSVEVCLRLSLDLQ